MVLVQKEVKRIMMRPNGTEKQIRPSGWGWWQPWANCVSWYPLDDDLKDQITDTSMTAYSWAILTTFNWVKCLDLTASGSYTSNSTNNCSVNADNRTHMWWIYWTWIGHRAFWGYWSSGYGNGDSLYWNQGDPNWVWWVWIQWTQYWKSVSTEQQLQNQWVCLALVINNNVATIYQNWASKNSLTLNTGVQDYKLNTASWTSLYFWKTAWDNAVAWKYIWEFVSYSDAKTATEVSDYYNSTKWTYWL